MADPYETLNVPRDASPDDITQAWRRASSARRQHDLDEAYALLIDPERRVAHDAQRPAPFGAFTFLPED